MTSTQPGKQALVVGGSSAIGSSIAGELARLGFRLSLWGRDVDRLRHAAQGCSPPGAEAVIDVVDVGDQAQLAAAVARVLRRGPLQVVVWAARLFDWAPADVADPVVDVRGSL